MVAQLRAEVSTTKAEAALLRAGYSGDKPEQMIKLSILTILKAASRS